MLQKKIETALNRVNRITLPEESIYVGHSGGKDSSVVLDLALQIFPSIKVIHNTKTLFNGEGTPGTTDVYLDTLQYLYSNVPKKVKSLTVLDSSKMKEFAEDNNLKLQIDGTRAEEFNRVGKSDTFEHNGILISRDKMTEYNPNGLFGLDFLYPIYDWTSKDVFDYHYLKGIKLSKEYLNDNDYLEYVKETGNNLV